MAEQEKNSTTDNPLNSFIPTKRDKARTDVLASKNIALAGILTFFILLAGLIYQSRGVNALKIVGYIFAVAFMFGLVTEAEDNSNSSANLIGLIGSGAITAEQMIAVNKARQRTQEKSMSTSRSNNFSSFQTNTEAIKLLKDLKKNTKQMKFQRKSSRYKNKTLSDLYKLSQTIKSSGKGANNYGKVF